jgi:hypothetical protein
MSVKVTSVRATRHGGREIVGGGGATERGVVLDRTVVVIERVVIERGSVVIA